MTEEIALILGQDGITNGAIYALLALALVLVYAVTRVVFVPQGEFITYGALTLASLQNGIVPGTIWVVMGLGAAVAVRETWRAWWRGEPGRIPMLLAVYVGLPALLAAVVSWLAPHEPSLALQLVLTLLIVVPLGPLLYRFAFEPAAGASVLLLLIIAVAVHFAMVGLALLVFGAEGWRTEPISDAQFAFGTVSVTGQSVWVVAASGICVLALYLFFDRSMLGKALRATAVNRVGARLVGIRTQTAGRLCFTLAAAIGAISGILISPLTTIYYDSGFLIGLKGFVAAIIGGLVSYPIAAAGALLVGLLESFSSFWWSAFKEVIVFTLIIPVLLWRSLRTIRVEGDEE
jgi:branched-subunit amino acid ABC-type transport system permease component